VNLDFSEEDIPLIDPLGLAEKGRTLGLALGRLAETFVKGRRLREGARVVLAGPPNAGKSSLFNALAGEDRAIVTAIPGTTRDTLEESLDIRGIPVVLVDTAGLRETDDLVERLGVERTHRAVKGADLVLRLVGPDDPDVATDDSTSGSEGELIVHSKVDLRRDRPGGLAISTLTGEGLEALKEKIAERLGLIPREGLVIVRERQYEALKIASEACLRAAEGLTEGLSPELPAVDLQDAMEALDRLVGKTTIEDMLDRLFSTFCIGK
jgi:tRNA modification GTPase